MAKTHTDLALVPGAIAGGAAGAHTLTGIKIGDRIVAVWAFVTVTSNMQTVIDITAEFLPVTADDTIDNTGGTDTTADFLVILYYPIGAGINYGANAGKDY